MDVHSFLMLLTKKQTVCEIHAKDVRVVFIEHCLRLNFFNLLSKMDFALKKIIDFQC